MKPKWIMQIGFNSTVYGEFQARFFQIWASSQNASR